MKTRQMFARLAELYGQGAITVHSQYHVQLTTSAGETHDIWFTKNGSMKWSLALKREVRGGSQDQFLAAVARYRSGDSSVAQMTAAMAVVRDVERAADVFRANGITYGCWCDASFKDGRALIAAVFINGEEVTSVRRPVKAEDVHQAERFAISAGIELAGGPTGSPTVPVYSDSRYAVSHFQGDERVRWVGREGNVVADKLSTLRAADRLAIGVQA